MLRWHQDLPSFVILPTYLTFPKLPCVLRKDRRVRQGSKREMEASEVVLTRYGKPRKRHIEEMREFVDSDLVVHMQNHQKKNVADDDAIE